MIKEFALGLARRHYFQDATSIHDWMKITDSDVYMSLYDYDDDIKTYFAKNNTISGYDGKIYIPDEFILDVDGANPEDAKNKAIGLMLRLDDLNCPFKIYFSGTGFHFHVPEQAFRWVPSETLHKAVKDKLTETGIFEYADPSVTDKVRIIRVPNTRNQKSNLFKVEISRSVLEGDLDNILEYAKKPQAVSANGFECDPVWDVLVKEKEDKKKPSVISEGRSPDPINYPCISSMLNSIPVGSRHATALRLAAWFRWRYPEDFVRGMMEQWRKQVDNMRSPFKKSEMDKIVKDSYQGHNGNGYRYGCSDTVMDDHCKNTCRLFKSKKNQVTLDASKLEDELIDFYRSDIVPVNIGKLYGGDFPVYPGEVVILQAPPKSMKTMLLQNWMVALRKPTFFLEMEMSPRQIWSRFVMIKKGWSEKQLREHYRNFKNGINKEFEWLQMSNTIPYAFELEKIISMLPVKPEIVVIDHMGLFKSKQRDPNMAVEEASQAMMELAIRHNLIVFSVSEITKSAFKEGMNIASSKGSFRTAYNANKVLSLKPYKSRTTGLIEALHITCEANREREQLDVRLKVNNVRLEHDTEAHE